MRPQSYVLVFLMFSSSFARADWSKTSSMDFEMDAPPAAGSVEERQDYEVLFEKQKLRSENECALAGRQEHAEFEAFYRETTLLSPVERQNLVPLMNRVVKFTDRVSDYFKGTYKRQRPYDVDSRLQPCVKKPGGRKSYPSSHASIAWTTACLLAQAYPERAQELKEYGIYLGDLRVVVGVHHPSDVRAGRALGDQICRLIWSDPDFQADLKSRL